MSEIELTIVESTPIEMTISDSPAVELEMITRGQTGATGPQGNQGIQGEQGIQGVQGEQGVQGATGDNAYTYIAYASDASGTGFTLTFDADLDYIAILSTDTAIASPIVTDFAGLWKNYKGATGDQGIQGIQGETGLAGDDAYVYIAYASDDTGTGFTTTFNSALDYIAIKTTTTAIVSPAVGDFAGLWKNYKGATGATGPQGDPGTAEVPGGTTNNLVKINASDQLEDAGVSAASFAPALGADDNYATDAEKTKLANLSGTNTGDSASIPMVTPGDDGNLLTATGGAWTSAPPPVSVSVTNKGDLQTHDGSSPIALSQGSDGDILEVRNSEPSGLKWIPSPSTASGTIMLISQVFN